jgi:plasmid stabilization system protein ParE
MTFAVIVTPSAEHDLRQAYRCIRRDSPSAAARWIRTARKSIKSLASNPDRCPLAPESRSFEEPIRELFLSSGKRGTYRALFVVLRDTVYLLHVRHGSQDTLHPE